MAGKPTVRKAQSLGGNRMTEKRMPVAERQQETGTRWLALRWSSRITGRRREVVPGPERVLTRSGEPVEKKMAMTPEPKDKLDAATALVDVANGPEDVIRTCQFPGIRLKQNLGIK